MILEHNPFEKISENEFKADGIKPFMGKGFKNGMMPPPVHERNNSHPAY